MSKRMGFFVAVAVCALLTSVTAVSAQDVDVSGDWVMSIATPGRGGGPGRTLTGTLTLAVEGTEITGTFTREGAESGSEVTGTIEGTSISFSMAGMGGRGGRRGGGGGGMQLAFTGTVEGESMSGTVQFGDFGSGDWSAQRPE